MTQARKITTKAVEAWREVRKSAKPSKRIAHLIRLMNFDLYYGPLRKSDAAAEGFRGWKGFTHHADELVDWFDSRYPSELYYNDDFDGVSESAPESWYDEDIGEWVDDAGDWYQLTRKDIAEGVFGRELANTIM